MQDFGAKHEKEKKEKMVVIRISKSNAVIRKLSTTRIRVGKQHSARIMVRKLPPTFVVRKRKISTTRIMVRKQPSARIMVRKLPPTFVVRKLSTTRIMVRKLPTARIMVRKLPPLV